MDTFTFDNEHLAATIKVLPGGQKIQISGRLYQPAKHRAYRLLASRPIDRRTSYAGSGLPFPCPEVAFQGTPNLVDVPLEGRVGEEAFQAEFSYPNSYNTYDAKTKVLPSVFVILYPKEASEPVHIRLELPDPLPLRTLVHRAGHARGPAYYADKEHVFGVLPTSAEQAMHLYGDMKESLGLA